MRSTTTGLTSLTLGVGILLLNGCGGGGGGGGTASNSNRPPYAGEPTCSDDKILPSKILQSSVGGGDPKVFVPPTSIERPQDIGVRVHTNHLISLASVSPDTPGSSGFSPQQIASAYSVPSSAGAGAIAIVDAYNYPTALSDFNTFSNNYGLPTESSTSATASSNSVFRVVYATGSAPSNDGGWSQEMAIDIEWAHAMAPQAKIYLVEAASSSFPDIMAAISVAKKLPGVREVSTSFGGTETGCFYVDYDSTFTQSGVAFFSAAGDTAAVRNYPALSKNVVAVGGTSLNLSLTGSWYSETVWNSTGCGPSAYEPRPVFQDVFYKTIGLYRGGCDIGAVADPNTGVAVYDSYPYQGYSGWFVAGGTSVACPIVAGIANASGVSFASSQAFNTALYSLQGSSYFHAITSGSSGGFDAGSPYCFPTGLGSPNNLTLGLQSAPSAIRSAAMRK